MDNYGGSILIRTGDCFLVWLGDIIWAIKMIDNLWYVREFRESDSTLKNASNYRF